MKSINRRSFLKSSAALGGAAFGMSLLPKFLYSATIANTPDVVSISSIDPMQNISKLLEPLGGIEAFVKEGQSVGFLVNSPWIYPGYYTHPDIVFSMMKLCKEAGAGDIICYKPVREDYWQESKYYEEMKPLIEQIIYGSDRVTVDIPKGNLLKSADVFKVYLDSDVFINIPVAKHHNGTQYSGTLKGLMGVSSRETNRFMHSPPEDYTNGEGAYLSGCIADLNLIRQADLSVVDAGICAINNGPRGPGDTTSPERILAGTDALAIDVYAASLIGTDPTDVLTFQKASEHGLGNADLASIKVLSLD